MKLEVQNLPDGKVRSAWKVWLASEAEPAAWMIERIDPIPNPARRARNLRQRTFRTLFRQSEGISNK
jgi:hypothetical protein